MISTGTGIVTVTGTQNYEQQVFRYTAGSIDITNPLDPDALINAQTLIDYVSAYDFSDTEDRIVAVGDQTSYVEVISGSEKTVRVVLGNTTVGEFTETDARIHRVLISDNTIRTIGNGDLVLQPGLNGTINVSNYRISNLADPVNATDAVNLQYLNSKFSTIGALLS